MPRDLLALSLGLWSAASVEGPRPGEGPHFDPHEIAIDRNGSIFTAEVLGWRAQKLRLFAP